MANCVQIQLFVLNNKKSVKNMLYKAIDIFFNFLDVMHTFILFTLKINIYMFFDIE